MTGERAAEPRASSPSRGSAHRARRSRSESSPISPLYLAPAGLNRLLAFAERVDRHRRHIRPIRREGVLGVEPVRYRGPTVVLLDGTTVDPGAPIILMHLLNERVRALATSGWQGPARHIAREDLRLLVGWLRSQPPADRPVAARATTILGSIMRWERWEIRPYRRTLRARVDDWFMRWLLAYWSSGGRERVARARRMESVDAWISCAELARRYGGVVEAGDAEDGPKLSSG